MRTILEGQVLYLFDELDAVVQAKVRRKYRHVNVPFGWTQEVEWLDKSIYAWANVAITSTRVNVFGLRVRPGQEAVFLASLGLPAESEDFTWEFDNNGPRTVVRFDSSQPDCVKWQDGACGLLDCVVQGMCKHMEIRDAEAIFADTMRDVSWGYEKELQERKSAQAVRERLQGARLEYYADGTIYGGDYL